jgi:putative N-acetylmannosamine-6-phosphate epimerase
MAGVIYTITSTIHASYPDYPVIISPYIKDIDGTANYALDD